MSSGDVRSRRMHPLLRLVPRFADGVACQQKIDRNLYAGVAVHLARSCLGRRNDWRTKVIIKYEGKRGVVWYVKYRDADGRQVKERLGRASDGWNRRKVTAELRA